MNDILLLAISGILIFLGALGSVLPILPGPPLSYLGLIIFAWFSGSVSAQTLIVFGILVFLTIIVDVFAPAIAAKGRKASKLGVWGAIIGAFAGIFVLGPMGIIIGPFLGAFIGEMLNAAKTEHALRVAFAALLGFVVGSIFKLIVALGMIIYFIMAAIQHLSG